MYRRYTSFALTLVSPIASDLHARTPHPKTPTPPGATAPLFTLSIERRRLFTVG
jgi:hypothetical protein